MVIPCHYDNDFLFMKNTNPTEDQMFKREDEKMRFECAVTHYEDEIVV
jgi:hypothetical protein